MSKAILVMDMPSGCNECICKFATISGKMICRYTKKELKPKMDKPNWCPLKPMLRKKPTIGKESDNDILCMNAGYNTCIDELLSEKE